MVVTIKGFQGTMTDADWAQHYPVIPPTVKSAADLLVTAVGGARSVSVAAGESDADFMQYINSAAQTIALSPPTSGGKWYVIARLAQWSPTNAVTVVAVDIGVATDGTPPTGFVPAAAMAGVLRNVGTPVGAHHLLCAVHVRAADTTLTLFDLRLIPRGDGGVVAQNTAGLWVLSSTYGAPVGTQVPCADGFTYRWSGTNWELMPLPKMMCHCYWGNTNYGGLVNGWGDIPNDTPIFDPFGMRQSDNFTYKLPWLGRYSLTTRVTLVSDDTATRYILGWNYLPGGTDLGWVGMDPVRANIPKTLSLERVLPAGAIVKPRYFKDNGITQNVLGGSGGATNFAESIIRYLGPA